VLTKVDFVRRYALGEFGNRTATWNTLEEYLASGSTSLVHVRNRKAGGSTYYNLSPRRIARTWHKVAKSGGWYISEMAPTNKTILQGEVRESPNGLDLLYTTVAKPMREALAESQSVASGLRANWMLKEAMCPNSYEWLGTLLDRYPNHVVEFSTYSVNCGVLPRYNTLFWEVRLY